MPVRDHITFINKSGSGEATASAKLAKEIEKELKTPDPKNAKETVEANTKLDRDEKRVIAEGKVGQEEKDEKEENLKKAEDTRVKPGDVQPTKK